MRAMEPRRGYDYEEDFEEAEDDNEKEVTYHKSVMI